MLGIVVVTYKNDTLTINYINNELAKVQSDKIVIVVDVGHCTKDTPAYVKHLNAQVIENENTAVDYKHQVFVLVPRENLGYAKGNNYGYNFLKRYFPKVDSVLFSNNDIIFKDDTVLDILYQRQRDGGRDFAVLGPRIITAAGRDQGPFRKLSLTKYLMRYIFPVSIWTCYWDKQIPNATSGYYYWLGGCFLLISREAFEAAGKFDEETFIYQEEQILSERLAQAGYRYYYCADLAIVHQNGASINKYNALMRCAGYSFTSEMIYYRKYIGITYLQYLFALNLFHAFLWRKKMGNRS